MPNEPMTDRCGRCHECGGRLVDGDSIYVMRTIDGYVYVHAEHFPPPPIYHADTQHTQEHAMTDTPDTKLTVNVGKCAWEELPGLPCELPRESTIHMKHPGADGYCNTVACHEFRPAVPTEDEEERA